MPPARERRTLRRELRATFSWRVSSKGRLSSRAGTNIDAAGAVGELRVDSLLRRSDRDTAVLFDPRAVVLPGLILVDYCCDMD